MYTFEYKDKVRERQLEEKLATKDVKASTNGKVLSVGAKEGDELKKGKTEILVMDHEKGTFAVMKILLALDDSVRTMDEAVRLASERGAGLTALFVLDAGWSVFIGSDFLLGSHARGDFLEYTRDDELAQERATVAAFEERPRCEPARRGQERGQRPGHRGHPE